MGNVNRAMETLKRISEFEDRPSSNRNAKRKNDFFLMKQNIKELWNNCKRQNKCEAETQEGGGKEKGKEIEKGREDISEVIMAEKFSKLMTDTKPQIQRNSENTKQNKYPKNLYLDIPNYRKPKIKI